MDDDSMLSSSDDTLGVDDIRVLSKRSMDLSELLCRPSIIGQLHCGSTSTTCCPACSAAGGSGLMSDMADAVGSELITAVTAVDGSGPVLSGCPVVSRSVASEAGNHHK